MSDDKEDVEQEMKHLKEELKELKEEIRRIVRSSELETGNETVEDKIKTDTETSTESGTKAGGEKGTSGDKKEETHMSRGMIFSKSSDGSKVIIDIGSMGEIVEEVMNGIKGEIQKSIFIGKDKVIAYSGREEVDEVASSKVFSALGNEHRVRILKELATGGMYASELEDRIPISASTISSHLKVLEDSRLVLQEAVRGRYLITMLGRKALNTAKKFSGDK